MVSASRQRDILPLPFFSQQVFDVSKKLSRSVKKRVHQNIHHNTWANQCISAVNSLSGHGASDPAPLRCENAGSLAAMDVISSAFRDVGKPPPQFLQ